MSFSNSIDPFCKKNPNIGNEIFFQKYFTNKKNEPRHIIPPKELFKSSIMTTRVFENVDIDHIEFTFMSEEEIENGSVVEITETKLGGPKSLYDPRMGPVTNKDICASCEQKWECCPGHYGHIKLGVKIPHPVLYKKILEYLRIFCMECQRLVITDKHINIIGANKIRNDQKFKKIWNDVQDNIDCCMHCKTKIPNYYYTDEKYIKELKDKKLPVSNDEIAT